MWLIRFLVLVDTTTGRNRKKKILFVVPRVVLADQQLEVIKQQLEGLPEELTRVCIEAL